MITSSTSYTEILPENLHGSSHRSDKEIAVLSGNVKLVVFHTGDTKQRRVKELKNDPLQNKTPLIANF